MKKEVYKLTEEGKARLEAEHEDLISVQRPRNVEAIKEARAQGDLSENADYDAARDEQARIEGRILEIETILKNCIIISKDDSENVDAVEVGKTVEIEFLATQMKAKYTIVGTIEANPFENKISDASPLGLELTSTVVVEGKTYPKYHKGDVAVYTTESGRQIKVKIVDVTTD